MKAFWLLLEFALRATSVVLTLVVALVAACVLIGFPVFGLGTAVYAIVAVEPFLLVPAAATTISGLSLNVMVWERT